ncbi:MAG: DNA-binding response regulator [Chloroflexi bacterium]|nr:DNA-binding response regulator [Chloroflexota bacterium]
MLAILFAPDADEAAVLTLALQRAGFEVRMVLETARIVSFLQDRPAELVFLSPLADPTGLDGLVRQIRAESPAPMVLLLEKEDENARIALFSAGADLVLLRPMGTRVLIAQLRALMRRAASLPYSSLPALAQGSLTLDPAKRAVTLPEGSVVRLTQLEFRLLYTLMTQPGRIISSENLIEYVWGYGGAGSRTLVRGLVKRLRAKLEEDPANPALILTEKGSGYSFDPGPSQ